MSHLILVRHGQSEWNLENKFTGWVDVELAPQGKLAVSYTHLTLPTNREV